jgi:hypothetical protein
MLKLLAALIAIGLAMAGPAASQQPSSQPGSPSWMKCVKDCEARCARSATVGRCTQACAHRGGCF